MRKAQIAGAAVVALVAIQFVPVRRENPPETGLLETSGDVKKILDTSCMDCHSNQTIWPWYAQIAPVSWLVAYDVNEGREHLNFSEFTGLPADDQKHAFEEIIEVIDEGEMPLPIYPPLHPEAELTDAEKTILVTWAQDMLTPKSAPADVSAPSDVSAPADGSAVTDSESDAGEAEDHSGHDHD